MSRVRSCVAVFLLGALLALPFWHDRAMATEQILSDPNYQLGLLGYDPVAFFADDGAQIGSPDYEIVYRGLVWRFVHEGNQHAFMSNPRYFLPAYGGFDALKAADGAAVASDPRIYLLLGQRLFFFSTPANRYAFLLEAERIVARADAKWPQILRQLAP